MSGDRAILHADMDAFFASVEQLDQAKLRGRPVLVGGDGPRGVVAAASYEARAFGCHSAQPMAVARRLCPDAAVVPVRAGRYRQLSGRVFSILESFTPVVQPLSIDEAFLDVTGSGRLYGSPRSIAEQIRHRIFSELSLTASVGVGPNMFVAKLASGLQKPDGLTVIAADRLPQTLAPLAIGKMWGVGPATEQRLARLGVHTFGQLQRLEPIVLQSRFGIQGRRMAQLAWGKDARRVTPDRRARSLSQEQTFDCDIEKPDVVRAVLMDQVDAVAHRLRRAGCHSRNVAIKVRFGDFQTITRSGVLNELTDQFELLWKAADGLYSRWTRSSFQPVRLIGFTANRLARVENQLRLFTRQADQRGRVLDSVTDQIRAKFGDSAIGRGLCVRGTNP